MNAQTNKHNKIGWVICSLAAIFYCYEFLLRMEPSVMVPELMSDFKATATQLGILSAIYYFVYTPMQILVGLLTDLYGSRKVLTAAVIACALGSLIFGMASSLSVAAFGRLLIGLGSAFAFVNVLKLASTWLPKKYFALFAGATTALGMLGAMVGDIALTSIVHAFGWKATITIGTVTGFVLIPLIWLVIRDTPEHHQKKIKAEPLYRKTFQGLIQILKNPQVWLVGLVGCLLYLSLSAFAELWGIPFLSNVYHLSAHTAAMACSMVFLGWLIGGPLIGYTSDRIGQRGLPLKTGSIVAAFLISVIIFVPSMPISMLFILLFLFGIFSSAQILVFAINCEGGKHNVVATAAAFTNCLVMVGGIIFQPLIGKVLDLIWDGTMINGIRSYSALNYQHALAIIPLLLLGCFVLTFWVREAKTTNHL